MLKEVERYIVKMFKGSKRTNKKHPYICVSTDIATDDETNELIAYRFSIFYDENIFKECEDIEDIPFLLEEESKQGQV